LSGGPQGKKHEQSTNVRCGQSASKPLLDGLVPGSHLAHSHGKASIVTVPPSIA
jgi:hypothetical protein